VTLASWLCGIGRRGLEHIELLRRRRLCLRGVHDQSPERAGDRHARAGCPARPIFGAILAETAPDLVVIATPPRLRYRLDERLCVNRSVRAIVVEKPLALSLAEADQTRCVVVVGASSPFVFHQLRFCPSSLHCARRSSALSWRAARVARVVFGRCSTSKPHGRPVVLAAREQRPGWVTAHEVDDLVAWRAWRSYPPDFRRLTGTTRAQPGPRLGSASRMACRHAELRCARAAHRARPWSWLQKRIVAVGTRGTPKRMSRRTPSRA